MGGVWRGGAGTGLLIRHGLVRGEINMTTYQNSKIIMLWIHKLY